MLVAFIEYLLIGMVAGCLAGLLGTGGGVLVVPFLVFVFSGQAFPSASLMHIVAGTSLAAMVAMTLFSLRVHSQRGIQIWPIFKKLLVWIIIGTVSGAILADFLHSELLRIFFGIFVSIMAFKMFFPLPLNYGVRLPGTFIHALIVTLIGAISGLIGAGGSTLLVPYLVHCHIPIRNAMVVATACSFMIAITGMISFIILGWSQPDLPRWSTGYVYWPAVAGITLVSPWFATLGANLSHKLPVSVLKRILAIFLLLVGLRMLIN